MLTPTQLLLGKLALTLLIVTAGGSLTATTFRRYRLSGWCIALYAAVASVTALAMIWGLV